MKKLALGALLVGLSAACGGGGGGGVKLLDAGIDAPTVCDPVAKTGCASGEKCTWIVDLDATASTGEVGHIGCEPAGTIADGAACIDATAATGTDGCVVGDLCIANKCKPICDPLAAASAAGACTTNYSCTGYEGVFVSGTTVSAGVCEPGCDPLTQKLLVGDLEACGSPDPTQPTATCVPSDNDFQAFSCAPSGPRVYANTDRKGPLTDLNGGIYPNGCAPGFIPFYFDDLSSRKTICSGLCAPAKVDSEIAKTNPTLNEGDPEALGKLIADATAIKGHATCAVDIKGSDANGEDCRFLWTAFVDSAGNVADRPYNDSLGVCFAFSNYIIIDTTDDGIDNPTLPAKSCAQLGIVDDPIYDTAEHNGCYPLTETTSRSDTAFRKSPRWAAKFRVGYEPVPLVRHVFD